MRTITFIIALLLLASFITTGEAGEESGGYAGSFLEWGAGARAIAMGKTFTAIANDGTALYWNPAGLPQLSTWELSAMHSLIFEDRSQNFLALTYPLSKLALGAGWLRFGVSDIQERSVLGELTGKFDDSENVFIFGSGYNAISFPVFKLNVGFAAKYFYHSLHNYRGSGLGLDLGILSYFNLSGFVRKVGVGLSVQNLGAKLKWNTPSDHEDDFPTVLRVGSVLNLKAIPFKMAVDLENTENQDLRIHAGVEFWIRMLALRAGLNQDKPTAGAGLVMKLANYGFIIDYAFTTDDVTDKALHFFMLSVRF